MKLTKKEEHLLKSLPEATPVLRGKDAERFLKEFNEVNKRVEEMKQDNIDDMVDDWFAVLMRINKKRKEQYKVDFTAEEVEDAVESYLNGYKV
jgi:hypothetical protein